MNRAVGLVLVGVGVLGAVAIGWAAMGGGGEPAWSVKENTMPLERSEATAAVVDGKVYILSGHTPGTQATGFIQEYDPATGEWRDLPHMPYVASHAGAAAIDGKIYHVGGFVANVHIGAIDRVYEFDTATESWQQLPSLSAPRGSPGVVALNGRIHVIGGRDPDLNVVTTHEIFDPATETWTLAAPLPVGRDHLGIAVLDGRIHVFGGRTGATEARVGNHDVYDPATDTWTTAAPLNVPRSAGAAFALDGKLVYAGGECKTPDADPRLTFDEAEIYDPATDSWTNLPTMLEGRHAIAVAVIGEEGLIFGGNAGCGGDLRRDTIVALGFN